MNLWWPPPQNWPPIQNTSQSLEVETSWKQLPLMSQQDLGFWGVGYDSAHVQCKGSLERWSVIFWFSLYVCIMLLRLYRTSTQKRPPWLPQNCAFFSGTCTNRKSLISFKNGEGYLNCSKLIQKLHWFYLLVVIHLHCRYSNVQDCTTMPSHTCITISLFMLYSMSYSGRSS